MKSVKKIILISSLFLTYHVCLAQKKIIAIYSGMDHHSSQELKIYNDSSFVWVTEAVFKTKRNGYCIFYANKVTFLTKKTFAFLMPTKKLKYRKSNYRIVNDKILLFPISGDGEYYNETHNHLFKSNI